MQPNNQAALSPAPIATPPSEVSDPMIAPKTPPPEAQAGQPLSSPTDSDNGPVIKVQKKQKAPKDSDPNVTLAIIASVVIVLGLAALAVYAYTKTH
jgi:hypothetical protein